MDRIVLDRLFDSFGELERAICTAKLSLAKRESVSPTLLNRIRSYEEMLAKQRSLAQELVVHMGAANWSEVDRHIRLINSYSVFIRDDAREVVNNLQPPMSFEEREQLLC